MNTAMKLLVLPVVVLLALTPGVGQEKPAGVSGSFGVRGGMSFPLGEWMASPSNASVDMFGSGYSFEADLDFAIGSSWTLGFAFGYMNLDGSAWEDYVSRQGEKLDVSAHDISIAVLLRPHLIATYPDFLRLEFGPAGLFASGEETYQGTTFQYDFLNDFSLGFQGGVEYTRYISDVIGLSAHAAFIVFPTGIEYLNGEKRTVMALPVTLGFRFMFNR